MEIKFVASVARRKRENPMAAGHSAEQAEPLAA